MRSTCPAKKQTAQLRIQPIILYCNVLSSFLSPISTILHQQKPIIHKRVKCMHAKSP